MIPLASTYSLPPPDATHGGLLQSRLLGLAGIPDDSSEIETDLIVVAELAARLITVIDHASVTRRSSGTYATAAASSEIAVAIDLAQYDDSAGPCLEALETGHPAAVPDIAATMTWPRFRDTAAQLGVRASLSLPLFAGSGRTIASLNLYSSDPGPMPHLVSAVAAAYDPQAPDPWSGEALDPGGQELAAGLTGAVRLRSTIQRAVRVLAATEGTSAHQAYLTLCTRAAESGTSLAGTAARITGPG